MIKAIRIIYLNNRLFQAVGVLVALFILAFVLGEWVWIPKILFLVLLAIVLTDVILLYRVKTGLKGARALADKLSNGDENEIVLQFQNLYAYTVTLRISMNFPISFKNGIWNSTSL